MVHEGRVIDYVCSKFDEALFDVIDKTSGGNGIILSRNKNRSPP